MGEVIVDVVDLKQFEAKLEALAHEVLARGMPHTIRHRILSLRDVVPQIEKVRQTQDRTNG